MSKLWLALIVLLAAGCGKQQTDKPKGVPRVERHEIVLPAWTEVDLPSYVGPVTLDEIRFVPDAGIVSSPVLHRHFLRDTEIAFAWDERNHRPFFRSIGEFTENTLYRWQFAHGRYGSSDEAIWSQEKWGAREKLRITLRNKTEHEMRFDVLVAVGEFDERVAAKPGFPPLVPERPDDGLRFHDEQNPDVLMADLARFEAKGDYLGAQWYLDDIAYHFDLDGSLESMFKLRSLAYELRHNGHDAVAPLLAEFLMGEEDLEAQSQAIALQDLFASPGINLVLFWTPSQLRGMWFDGREVDPATNGFGLFYSYNVVHPGKHVIGLEFERDERAPEVQMLWLNAMAAYTFDHAARLSTSYESDWAEVGEPAGTWRQAEAVAQPFAAETPAHAFLDLHRVPVIRGIPLAPGRQALRFEILLPGPE